MLHVENLHACITESAIPVLQGLDLHIGQGEVSAIMGPNGSGKSTLSQIIAGRRDYEVTGGDIFYQGKSILPMSPDERALAGIFLAFQYPVEIPGVSMMEFLKIAINAHRKACGQNDLRPSEFLPMVKSAVASLEMDPDMLKRSVNTGFSGGEKKRAEMLQMMLLAPRLCILDETDSGLDIDSLRIVSRAVNSLRSADRSIILITHYQRLLEYIQPDSVHVLYKGQMIKSGNYELAKELEVDGYTSIINDFLSKD